MSKNTLYSRQEGCGNSSTSMEVPQKTKYRTTIWSIPLLGIYPDKTFFEKDTCTPVFIAVLFTIAQIWKRPKCPSTDEWIKKMWYTYTMEYYSAIKKDKLIPFCSNMAGTRDSHTKWSKPERKRQTPYEITYLWNLKYGTDDPIIKMETDHSQGEQTCGSQEGGG